MIIIEEKFVDTKYGRICYLEAGEGEKTLIFFHGFLDGPEGIKYLTAVLGSKGFKIIAPYLPGHGKSFSLPKGFYFSQATEVMTDFINKLCPGHFFLFGASFGGGLAWSVACQLNNRLDRMVLHVPLLKPLSLTHQIKSAFGLAIDRALDGFDLMLGRGGSWPTATRKRITVRTFPGGIFRNGLLNLLRSVDLDPRGLPKDKKVLFLWGEKDHAVPFSWVSDFVGITGKEVKFFPGGHFMFLRQFPKFLDSIVEYVSI